MSAVPGLIIFAISFVFLFVFLPRLGRWLEVREKRLERENVEKWQRQTHAPGCVYVVEEVDS